MIYVAQFQVESLLPLFKHLNQLMQIPAAMNWQGESAFELSARSEYRGDGKIYLRKYLIVRTKLPDELSESISSLKEAACRNIRAWFRMIDVHYQTINEPLPPISNFQFIVKNARACDNGYQRLVLPLESTDCPLDFKCIEAQLYRHPDSGVSFHLMPAAWRIDEKRMIERFAPNHGIPREVWQEMVNAEVYGFICNTWGINAEALAQVITFQEARLTHSVGLRGTVSEKALETNDPWQAHQQLNGRNRMAGWLTLRELMQCFDCVALDKGIAEHLTEGDATFKELKKQLSYQEQFINNLVAQISTQEAEQKRLAELLERQELLGKQQLEKLQILLQKVENERDDLKAEIKNKLARATVQGATQPLSQQIVNLIGMSEQDLLNEGMSEKQLSVLRIAATCLAGTPVLENNTPPANDTTEYHIYTLYLGFLYEMLLHECHHSLHLAYYRFCMPASSVPPSVKDTPMSHYDMGPEFALRGQRIAGYRRTDWQGDIPVERFAKYVTLDGKQLPKQYWQAYFTRMRHIREARNYLHREELPVDKAYSYVNFMLKSSSFLPCMIRMFLEAKRAVAAFPENT